MKHNLILSLSVADCTPVCIFDPASKNYALVHSGWRGTYKKISNNAIKLMLDNESKIEDIMVYIGPSISQKNYEIGNEIISFFSKKNLIKSGEKHLLDIKAQIIDDLIAMDIDSENISYSCRCTYNETYLQSFRRDGENAGRLIFLMGRVNGRN